MAGRRSFISYTYVDLDGARGMVEELFFPQPHKGKEEEDLPALVGVSGKSGSGKDRFYSLVLAPMGYTRLPLADAVRTLSAILIADNFRDYGGRYDQEKLLRAFATIYPFLFTMEKTALSRVLQQHIGTDLGRAYDEGYWMKVISPLVQERLAKGIKVAITDIRFPNEADWIHSLGGVVVRVEGYSRYESGSLESNHPSEHEVDLIPYDLSDEEFVRRFFRRGLEKSLERVKSLYPFL